MIGLRGPAILADAAIQSDGSTGLFLSDRCAIRRMPTGGDILDPYGDNVAATKPAVDSRLNMAWSRNGPSIRSFVRIDQTCFDRRGGFAPVSLPLVHGTSLRDARVAFLDPAWSCFSVSVTEAGSMSHRTKRWKSGRFLADFVAKVENRTIPKISRKVIFREL
ncbi:hypothetical protein CP49_36770 [Bradyrhizobium valentinum]|uniref:Uncharacterized protein n=1 Tax=Bradyrhizobium valentinum TaxID=1518501 RepID=A0A0R3LEW7_9BRAD|nr:hypothetical protein CP49_36770 [Bradyrhizobium valentinum]